ncbi:hypothetical protein RchiOBHm_Chr5g0005151 [Rosa chinensis]|uniref:Uncharacterized protein n=1 Tax=Rosa chinensis TaxID=74649 RepID=A0A2P6Q376_ROSCH|nr:hypothetical protein RchiOBHm_Chr5g0005151 [Rosa chinensis]
METGPFLLPSATNRRQTGGVSFVLTSPSSLCSLFLHTISGERELKPKHFWVRRWVFRFRSNRGGLPVSKLSLVLDDLSVAFVVQITSFEGESKKITFLSFPAICHVFR